MSERLRLYLGFTAFWLLCAAVATVAFHGSVALGSIRLSMPLSLGRVVVVQTAPWLSIALLTPVVIRLAERLPLSGGRWGRTAAAHLAAIPLLAVAYTVFTIAFAALTEISSRVTVRAIGTRLVSSAVVFITEYALIVGVVEAARQRQEARARAAQADRLARRSIELERDLAAARLLVLQHQLQPHFLFNALNAASSLVDEDPAAARQLISRLGDLLRASLGRTGPAETPLGDELEFTDRYLAVEQARFGDRLRVTWDIADETIGAMVPAFLLQPLAENAVRHGFARLSDGGEIVIGSARDGDRLRLWVKNAAPVEAAERPGGVGLAQTRARLDGMYGGEASMAAGRPAAGVFLVEVGLPWRTGGAPA